MHTQNLKDIVAAIESVQARLRTAYDNQDTFESERLFGDLVALHTCLLIDVRHNLYYEDLLESIEKAA